MGMAKTPTRVFVFPIIGRETEVARLKQIIAEAGCELVSDQPVASDYEKSLKEADVLVVLMCPETENDATVESLIASASRLGKRVVAVWLSGSTATELPAAINSHGDAAVTMDAGNIQAALCENKPIWVMPDGKPRPTPKTPRHKG